MYYLILYLWIALIFAYSTYIVYFAVKKFRKISFKKYVICLLIMLTIPFIDKIVFKIIYYGSCITWSEYIVYEINAVDGFMFIYNDSYHGLNFEHRQCINDGYKFFEFYNNKESVYRCNNSKCTAVDDILSKYTVYYNYNEFYPFIYDTKIIKRISDGKIVAKQKRVTMEYDTAPFRWFVLPIIDDSSWSRSSYTDIHLEAIPPNNN